ncbi:DUF134 domain-containing protein [Phytohabitans flavus]|uniref:Trypsin-co-occurring domain-containing protein n=1 Tax=Phytohabitans flavus TaxID=1076124 RepID=A0A6F8XNJ3_9ACTN|nr:trypco2 family protein [Phytohabitans flavus]BCB75321.1 hypothetical protein Pflav_017310 [Phytohabitans flavus]
MRVADDSVPVDELIADVKNSLRRAGVTGAHPTGDLRVELVRLTLRAVARAAGGAALELRIPVIGAQIKVGQKVTREQTHTIEVTLVPRTKEEVEVRGGEVQLALVEAIETIRAVLRAAAAGDDPLDLDAATVDLSFVVTRDGTISLGLDGELHDEIAHVLHLQVRSALA